MTKKIFASFLMMAALTVFSAFVKKPGGKPGRPSQVKTIIIDAGHGGKDHGARGAFSYEKDVCLAIALKLGKMLEEGYPDLKILYTRTTDTYPEIHERADFANKNGGDLFISIHANSMPPTEHKKFAGYRTQVYYTGKGKSRRRHTRRVAHYTRYYTPNLRYGTETYIWAADRSDEKGESVGERVAEDVYDSTSEFTPDLNDPEFKAKSLLWTKKFFDKSLTLASMVEEEFAKEGRQSLGVKQRTWRGIWVLQATAMPSILVETGFMSNPDEEKYLNSDTGQTAVASDVYNAVGRYLSLTNGKPSAAKGSSGNGYRAVMPATGSGQ